MGRREYDGAEKQRLAGFLSEEERKGQAKTETDSQLLAEVSYVLVPVLVYLQLS